MRAANAGLAFVLTLALSVVCAGCASEAPKNAAEELLARSIAFHDPGRVWGERTIELRWTGSNPDGEERLQFDFVMAPGRDAFEMQGHYKGTRIEYQLEGDQVSVTVDGEAEIDQETRDNLVLDREDGRFWRNYFGYLAALPMNLAAPGTHLDATPIATEFRGQDVQSLRVTYDAEVGTDTWTFYFRTETAELVGCRFTKADPSKPGEYIAFDGLVEAGGLRLPKRRSWYMNDDDRHLGDDTLSRLAVRE
ncbi:MAG: hypothetical protein GY716_25645 [bacterium]|nr:hypothetical protein [bacterium]